MVSILILIGILIGICSIYIVVNNAEMREMNNHIAVFIGIVTQLYTLFIDKFTTNYQSVICGAFALLIVFVLICYKIKNDTIKYHQNYLITILSFIFVVFCGVLTYATL